MPGLVSMVLEDRSQLEELGKLANFDAIAGPHFEGAMRAAVAMGRGKVVAELQVFASSNRSAMISGFGEDMQPLAPVNASVPGYRITSLVQVSGPMDMMGIVGDVNRKYLRLTEAGRGPGKRPPAGVLQDWAEEVLGMTPAPSQVYKSGKNKGKLKRDLSAGRALSQAIAKKGIKGSPVMDASGEAVERHVMGLFEDELRKVAAELGYV